jgi:hypothetical protein
VRLFYTVLTLLSLWLCLGPPLGLWPAVYWLPGMNFIRVPSRFSIVTLMGLAVLAAIGFERLTLQRPARVRLTAGVVLAALLVIEFRVPLVSFPFRVEPPAIDRWLDTQPKPFAIAEVPLPNPRNLSAWERRETMFMLHSMAHWQKTVHGYSGIRTPLHEALYRRLTRFPDDEVLDSLIALGVTYVVVHTDLYPPGQWEEIETRIDSQPGLLRLEHVEGDGRVYSLRPALSASSSR